MARDLRDGRGAQLAKLALTEPEGLGLRANASLMATMMKLTVVTALALASCGPDPIVDLEARTAEFARVAAEFCMWAEGDPGDPVSELNTAHRLTAKLYYLGLALPSTIELTIDDITSERISHDEFMAMYHRFASLPFDFYRTVAEPHDLEDLDANGLAQLVV